MRRLAPSPALRSLEINPQGGMKANPALEPRSLRLRLSSVRAVKAAELQNNSALPCLKSFSRQNCGLSGTPAQTDV